LEEGSVPSDWCDAVLIPILKKGNLTSCVNWRQWHGIYLLDVVGKVVARILQESLQKLAEVELPELQCGFQKGRGCVNMIFVVRQLIEKSWEHKSKVFFTFIDLKKAYDSIPIARQALWIALRKLGVPESSVQLIRSFHKAKIRLNGEALDTIDAQNGLCQGCCMAPMLFNLYTCLVVERWLANVGGEVDVGIVAHYKYDHCLFRRYTRNALERLFTDCLFADDGALLASMRSGAKQAA